MEAKDQELVHVEKSLSQTKQDSIHNENAANPEQSAVVQDWTEKEERALVSVLTPAHHNRKKYILIYIGGKST